MQKKQRIPKNIKEQRTKKAKGASAYDEALYFLTPKARTVREVENRLDECNYSEGEIMAAIDRLRNNGLLNDEKFARDFIESRLNTKPVSRGKLRRQLREHFVENAVIDEALSGRNGAFQRRRCRKQVFQAVFKPFSQRKTASNGFKACFVRVCV